MNGLAARVACSLLVVLLGVFGVRYVQILRDELDAARDAKKTALQGVADRDQTITDLLATAHQVDLARAKLDGERAAVRSLLDDREILIRKLQNENATVRAWAAVAVPDDIASLHAHPAFTGAASYREQMRPRDAVPPAGRVPAPE